MPAEGRAKPASRPNRPPVLLLDEPFGALDAHTRLRVHEWMRALLAERPTTTLLVTRDVEEALLLGDRLCLLSNRPATVVDKQPVPFGDERGRAVLSNPAFVRMKVAVLERSSPPDGSSYGKPPLSPQVIEAGWTVPASVDTGF